MLEITDLQFEYDSGETVFDELTVTVEPGQIVAVLGANGSGKTTLLRLLAGLLEPSAGKIMFDGESDPVVGLTPEVPSDGLFAATVEDEVAFFPKNRGLEVDARVREALEALEIEELADRSPHILSAGQQQLVSIAAVLSGAPDLVGLDEPTSGLDAVSWERLGSRLATLSETVLLATHDTDFAWRYTDRVLVLSGRGVARYGRTRSVLADEDFDLTEHGLDTPNPVKWARTNGIDPPPRSVTAAVEELEEMDK